MTDKQPTNQYRDHDADYINFVLMGIMFLVIASILVKYFAFAARYLYFLFFFPFYVARAIHPFIELILGMVICAILGGLWFYKKFFKSQKVSFLLLSYAVILFVAVATDFVGLNLFTGFMDAWCKPQVEPNNLFQYFTAIFSCSVSLETITSVSVVSVLIYSIFPNILIGMWANYQVFSSFLELNTKHPKALMKEMIDLEALIRIKTKQQPHLKYYQFFDLNKLPIDAGQFRKLDDGRKFMYRHNLIKEFVPRQQISLSSSTLADSSESRDSSTIKVGKDLIPIIKPDAFKNLMIEQLGEPFVDAENLSPLYTMLLALTIPRACLADTLLDNIEMNTDPTKQPKYVEDKIKTMIVEIWEWASVKINKRLQTESIEEINLAAPADASDFPKLEEYRAFLKEWIDFSYIAQKLIKQHYYCSTLLMASLSIEKGARKLGVLAPAEFRWLIEYDRAIWAIVQNTDRPAAFSENIGTVNHYYAELSAGVGLVEPVFQSAYEGFMKEVTGYNYPKEHIDAWEAYNKGDPSLMIRYRLITRDESIY